MKSLFILISIFCSTAFAADKFNMNFQKEELSKVIEVYSKASGQKFVIDPGVRGTVTILLPEPVTVEEAFNQLSTALAINGFAISKQGDTMIVRSSRNVQRDLIEVSTELPSLKPERMFTWIYKAKFISADEINRDLRILTSKDGEMSISSHLNQLVFTDYVSNLHRIAALLKELDQKADPAVAGLVEQTKKNRALRKAEREKIHNEKKNE